MRSLGKSYCVWWIPDRAPYDFNVIALVPSLVHLSPCPEQSEGAGEGASEGAGEGTWQSNEVATAQVPRDDSINSLLSLRLVHLSPCPEQSEGASEGASEGTE